ncbi:MAG: 3TM-type holin, partial [SAR324 cluster bacterium]|nr:3TM-type holin [SAR324 cluster bacterium]
MKTLFKTIDKTIDNKADAEKIKQSIQQQLLSGQLKELEAQASIIIAESKGSFLQRNWRPLLMLIFAGLIVAHWFGFTAPNIPESVQNSLLNIVLVGCSGYILGRSG